MHLRLVAAATSLGFLSACAPDYGIYTLYRESMTPQRQRIHVATFDAAEGENYNRENCSTARDLFANQPGVRVRYWCERGRFRI